METPARKTLHALLDAAISVARPDVCLAPHLPAIPPSGRLIVLGAGKAAAAMAQAAEAHYEGDPGYERLSGMVTTRHGYGLATRRIEVVEAGHPVPDTAGQRAAERTLALAGAATAEDLVLVLLSGGASALWSAPVAGLDFAGKQALTRKLLGSGARIDEMNTVRKHLSRIKGGRLAVAAHPAEVVTLAISDVPRDDPATIGSGPTVADPTTLADARAILAHYAIDLDPAVARALGDAANELVDCCHHRLAHRWRQDNPHDSHAVAIGPGGDRTSFVQPDIALFVGLAVVGQSPGDGDAQPIG